MFYRGKGSRKWEFVKEKCGWRPTNSEYWERHGNTHLHTYKHEDTELANKSSGLLGKLLFTSNSTVTPGLCFVRYYYERHAKGDATQTLHNVMKYMQWCETNKSDSTRDSVANNLQLRTELKGTRTIWSYNNKLHHCTSCAIHNKQCGVISFSLGHHVWIGHYVLAATQVLCWNSV